MSSSRLSHIANSRRDRPIALRSWPAWLLCVVLCLGSCGYRFVGPQGRDRGGPVKVWLGAVEDETAEPLFGAKFRRALAREVVDRSDASLASEGDAGATLTARVVSVKETVIAYGAGDLPREYLLRAEAEARLAGAGGQVLWKGLKIQADRQYRAGANVDETETNKQDAVDLLAQDLGREVLRRVSLVLSTSDR